MDRIVCVKTDGFHDWCWGVFKRSLQSHSPTTVDEVKAWLSGTSYMKSDEGMKWRLVVVRVS